MQKSKHTPSYKKLLMYQYLILPTDRHCAHYKFSHYCIAWYCIN